MIEHIVLLKFSEQTTQDQKDEALKKLVHLGNVLPGILDIQAGYDFSGRAQGYEAGLTVRFESKEALQNYGPSEAHQSVIKYLDEIGTLDRLVMDFELESK
ncbi:Dabb family protein [Pullulanibacillus sp. KACC 23026]|uniref:Dabb family protein n=1 Tax=Pullulanibacillus sp. KACC 23026 TaxID=3028315 RepID=UPI0023AF10FB|nr:Dabb family protein [Pullulanibacillus sp. KACC 23026]WEG10834.1 Dabb family protein [Pullulanibacillus sp. KACC 23026]